MKKGFTLIEFMIVIAIMSIIFPVFMGPVSRLLHLARTGGPEIRAQEAIHRAFNGVRDALAESTAVDVQPDLLDLQGSRWERIRRLADGAAIRFEDVSGKGITLYFHSAMRWRRFSRLDRLFIRCTVEGRLGDQPFEMVWRCGS